MPGTDKCAAHSRGGEGEGGALPYAALVLAMRRSVPPPHMGTEMGAAIPAILCAFPLL